MRAGMILPGSLTKSFRNSTSLESIHSTFSAVKRQNLRRRKSARCPLSFLSLPNFPLPFPLPLRGGGIFAFLFLSFDEFDVGHVQHQLLGALALRGEKAMQLQFRVQFRCCEEPRLRAERDAADFGLDLAGASGFGLLRLVPELELERGKAGGRVAQRAQLKQPAAQLEAVQSALLPAALRRRAPSWTSTSPRASSARARYAACPS